MINLFLFLVKLTSYSHSVLCGFFFSFVNFRFRLIEESSIEFKDFGLRDNVAQISAFEVVIYSCCYLLLDLNLVEVSLGRNLMKALNIVFLSMLHGVICLFS